MAFWKFKDYVTEDHRSPFLEWFGILDEDVQAALDLLLKNMAETENWDEVKPKRRKYKKLNRQHKGLYELLLKVGKRKFRPLGILCLETKEFIFFGGAEKVGRGTTDLKGGFNEALRLKEKFDEGRGETRDYGY